jgi:hypothetical protein
MLPAKNNVFTDHHHQVFTESLARNKVVPKAGLEPARLAAGDFESPASTIPPLGH